MKGTIESYQKATYAPKDGSAPRDYAKLKIEGDERDFACWQKEGLVLAVGNVIEFEPVENNGRWKIQLAGTKTAGGGGFSRAKSPQEIDNQLKSFSLAYAKDITVKMIGISPLAEKDPVEFTLHIAEIFLEWLKK